MIVQAGIRLKNGFVFTGKRHRYIIAELNKRGIKHKKCIAGFVTDKGKFLNRVQGAKYAYSIGQINKPKILLFSENLW